jgi:uncharacterized membrane protein YobD (UPF0266 family)
VRPRGARRRFTTNDTLGTGVLSVILKAMSQKIISWSTPDVPRAKKDGSWYATIIILIVGMGVASSISGNFLLSVLVVLGGGAIMIAGSLPPTKKMYALSETGVHINTHVFPYTNIQEFAIHEDPELTLVIRVNGVLGTSSIPLGTADHRHIRSELKNRNVTESERIESPLEDLVRWLGM